LAEVALSSALGHTFATLAEAALRTAEATFATVHFGAPWELTLQTESESGGEVGIKVIGDATARFTLVWEIASPDRPIDRWTVPTAFHAEGEATKGGREQLRATVHFPITMEDFRQFVERAYGRDAPERFTDFPLLPHSWLHLTVTGEADTPVVLVHFDAITTSGQRLFIAEAPASTGVGGRFVDETLARMQEMLDEEAAQPGSSIRSLEVHDRMFGYIANGGLITLADLASTRRMPIDPSTPERAAPPRLYIGDIAISRDWKPAAHPRAAWPPV
jgi:hypothetical protein